uniref:Transmembrane protein n=1 Tax=Pithovirus LCPAC102 TaxID=2506587 RepID=A0A4D5XFG9_9VIRU|nr:MAG: hypothetical protein LCPAC102_01640 [Pithovirus LCPAC102]
MDQSNLSYIYLVRLIVVFIITIIIYLLLLYVPTIEAENDFNNVISQTNDILKQVESFEDEIEDTNDLVKSGFLSLCEFNDTILADIYFGNSFDNICENI